MNTLNRKIFQSLFLLLRGIYIFLYHHCAKTTLFILFSCISLISFGQYELRGVVIDSKTKEPLPYVNYVVGSNTGGTTDDSGRFFISVNTKTDSIIFSYLGYKSEVLKKRYFKKDTIIIKLHLESFMLEEFTIKSKRRKIPKDTAAIRVFRNVVKHKDENKPKSFSSYQYEEYLKTVAGLYKVSPKLLTKKIFKPFRFILQNQDTTADGITSVPLILKETIVNHYVNKDPKKNKEVVIASKISGVEQLRFSELLDVAFDEVNVYSGQAVINGKTFVLPFADGGLTMYNYYIIDSSKGPDSIMQYNLAFTPKSKGDVLFNGKARIHGGNYAIMSIDLGIDRRANLNFVNEFSLKQGFENTDAGWFLKSEARATDIAFTKAKKSRSIRLARYMDRKDIIVEKPLPDSILRQDNTVFLKNYRKNTDSFWLNRRHDTLSVAENKVYYLLDSLKKTKFFKAIKVVGGLFASGYYKTNILNIGSIYQMATWNSLEGVRLRLNIKNNWRIGDWVNFKVYAAYGLSDKKFKYDLEISTKLPDKHNKYHSIAASYRDDYQRFNLESLGQDQDYDYVFNSLLRKKAIADLIYLKDFKFSYNREWIKDLSTTYMLNYKKYQAIPGKIDFIKTDAYNSKDTTRSFHSFSQSLNFIYTPGAKFLQTERAKVFLKGNLPRINFIYEFAIKGFGSDFTFHKLSLQVEERLPSPIGYTRIQLNATKIFGSVPYPLLTILPGNQSFLYNFKRFTNMNETEFIADQQVSLLFEHHFDGFFFNKIPYWKVLGLREVFITKMVVSSLDRSKVIYSDLPTQLSGLNGFYAEMGFGIENILKLVRVDFTWRLTQRNAPDAQKFRWTLYFKPSF